MAVELGPLRIGDRYSDNIRMEFKVQEGQLLTGPLWVDVTVGDDEEVQEITLNLEQLRTVIDILYSYQDYIRP